MRKKPGVSQRLPSKLLHTPAVFSTAPLPSTGPGRPQPSTLYVILFRDKAIFFSSVEWKATGCMEWWGVVLESVGFLNRLTTNPPLLNAALLSLSEKLGAPLPEYHTESPDWDVPHLSPLPSYLSALMYLSSQSPLVTLFLRLRMSLLPPLLCYLCIYTVTRSNMSS